MWYFFKKVASGWQPLEDGKWSELEIFCQDSNMKFGLGRFIWFDFETVGQNNASLEEANSLIVAKKLK